MLYLLGFIGSCFVAVWGVGIAVGTLQKKSKLAAPTRKQKKPPPLRSRALITFSIILPYTALSFLILTFSGMRIAQSQGQEGHLAFVIPSLFIPTTCFLVGYYYFKKVVAS